MWLEGHMKKATILTAVGTTALLITIATVAPAQAQKPGQGLRPHIVSSVVTPAPATIGTFSVWPGLISFNATTPGSMIPGSSTATVSFTINPAICLGTCPGGSWSLSVGAGSGSFQGCATVPASAISLRCVSASASGSSPASASCSTGSFVPLPSSSGQVVAGGGEPLTQAASYSVTVAYQLEDSWRFIPNSCPLNITYNLIAQ